MPVTDAPLRVLFALPGFHRINRGAEIVLEEVARRAARDHGLDITLLGGGPNRPGEPYRYRKLPILKREYFERFPGIPYLRDHYTWEDLSFAPGLLSAYSPNQYDITFTCNYPYTNWILRSRRRARRPLHVFVTQNGDWMVQARNWEYKHFSCDGLVCTNPEYFDRHKNRYRCALIPNGVDVSAFRPGAGDRESLGLPAGVPIVLIVSALIASKRVTEGIRAVANVPDAHLVIAGDGEQRLEVDSLGQQLLGSRFRRMTLQRHQMPELYRCADILLHMSKDEPFGNIYIEAMASGLESVAHDTPVTRWITGSHATLVDTDDLASTGQAIQSALSGASPARGQARQDEARRRFSWESVSRQYCEFFYDVFRHGN